MTQPPLWLILALPIALMAFLGWVGWTFFVPADFKGRERPKKAPGPGLWSRLTSKLPRWHWYFNTAEIRSILGFFKTRRALWLLVPIPIVGFMVTLLLSFSQHFDLDPLSAKESAEEGQASLRLNQEKLLPPPPLPPSMFINTEIPHLATADRDWSRLDPDFAQVVLHLFARMAKRGYPLALLEGYRSPERQDMLAAKGSSVTMARGNQSKHQFGLAADVAPMRDGRLVISEKDPWARTAYNALGEEAASLGLTWGGQWKNLLDFGHIERSSKNSLDLGRKK